MRYRQELKLLVILGSLIEILKYMVWMQIYGGRNDGWKMMVNREECSRNTTLDLVMEVELVWGETLE